MSNFENLAKKYVSDHKNPIRSNEIGCGKLFIKPKDPQIEKDLLEKQLNILCNCIKHDKVERRCGRAQAEWLPNENLAKVTKSLKSIQNSFGYQDKTGIYLLPEEMLFLLESNRLEVRQNNIPLTIEECYEIISKQGNYNLNKYMAYKNLVLQGYKLISYNIYKRKHKNEETGCSPAKRRKIMENTASKESNPQINAAEKIFEELKLNGPQSGCKSTNSSQVNPDYLVCCPKSGRKEPNFQLFICNDELPIGGVDLEIELPAIYALCKESVMFFQLSQFVVPSL